MQPVMRLWSLFVVTLLLMGASLSVKADTVDNYQIYLRKEIVITERDYSNPFSSTIKLLCLEPSHVQDTLFVNYNHCTQSPGKRRLIVKDKHEKIIFEKVYPDQSQMPLMAIPVWDLVKDHTEPYLYASLFYADDQTRPSGVWLTSLRMDYVPVVWSAPQKASAEFSTATQIMLAAAVLLGLQVVLQWRRKWRKQKMT